MARTRLEIQELVILNTARSDKISLIQKLCDTSLKLAISRHPFQDAAIEATYPITEDTSTVDVSDDAWINMRTLRIVDSSTAELSRGLTLKSNIWFDKNFPFPNDNLKGWPIYCSKLSTSILLDRKVEENRSLYVRGTVEQKFADDSTVCPIELLDIFVEEYVTAKLLMSYHEYEKAQQWMGQSLSSLKLAIENDTMIAQTSQAERGDLPRDSGAITTTGLQGSPQTYVRETGRSWY